ncbi:MAG TPA: Localization factor PodJS [Caulobacteraceae bacterium]|jgi:localization factor PodJL|nr:Localization factor PodJS [Caulobacteraceae bacterium]
MSAGAPWSVKGIDPKAREIAKDLARRSGMTLGEWLNQMIIEGDGDEGVVPFSRKQSPYQGADRRGRLRRLDDAYTDRDPPARDAGRGRGRVDNDEEEEQLSRVSEAIEALSARLETAENRTTLAIGGVDQAVAGLLARLETNERDQYATAERLENVAEDLRDSQGRVLDRLRELEHETQSPRTVEAMRALEGALGKIANQVLEADTRNRLSIEGAREDVFTLAQRIDRVETRPAGPDPQVLVDGVVARVAERLEQAEARTSGAIRTLESSLTHLDERLRGAENRLDTDRETRFEKLAADLSQRVEEARTELVRRFDAAADGRFDQVDRGIAELTTHVQAAEQRSAQAIERMGHEVLRIAQNLNRRMTGVERSSSTAVERVGGEMARVAHAVEDRLRKADDQQVQALEKLGGEIARISERLTERIAHSERKNALSADDVGERIGRVADKLEARYERASTELADRIRSSEERTARLLAEARETIDRSLTRDPRPVAPAPLVLREEPAPAPAFPAFPHQDAAIFDEPEADSIFQPAPAFAAPVFTAPAFAYAEPQTPVHAPAPVAAEADPVFDDYFEPPHEALNHDTLSPPPAAAGFDEFSADTEFMSPQELRAKPAVSTREAIEAARAAARLGVRNSADNGALFAAIRGKSKLNDRVEQQGRREGSTVKTALAASAVAMLLVAGTTTYFLLAQDQVAQGKPGGLKVLAGDLFNGSDKAAPLAAVALTPGGSANAGDQSEAKSLYQTAAQHIEDGASQGVNELSRAANLGYAPAQFYLASLYTNGASGVAKDPTEARRWTERAALGGDRRAMFNLGMFYYEGTGGPKDETEGANWLKKSAELGLVDGQYNLALLYERGLGLKRDLAEAYKWYLIAGRAGDETSRTSAARLRASLSDDQRTTAEAQAAAFKAPNQTEAEAAPAQ